MNKKSTFAPQNKKDEQIRPIRTSGVHFKSNS